MPPAASAVARPRRVGDRSLDPRVKQAMIGAGLIIATAITGGLFDAFFGSAVAGGAAADDGVSSLAPSEVRLSQSSVNGAAKIIESMNSSGWVGDPIDVVRMLDGGLTTIDNTRVVAADAAGIDVQAVIHGFDDPLPDQFIDRFTTPKGGVPSTWGDAILNRIGTQNSIYRNTHPFGSPFTGWVGN